MKNSKLLLTSALVGTVAMGAVANAETKISGSATYTYSTVTGATTAANTQGAGKEVQIDISNSSTLDNGLGFSAGFSLEDDGNSKVDMNEGNFMKFTSGNSSFMWNIDKSANLSTSATPRASTSINTMAAGMGTTSFDYSPGQQAQQSAWNMEFAQKFDGGAAYVVYTPRISDDGGNNDNIDSSQAGSSMDIIFKGNAGVDGLNILAAYSKADAPSSTLQDKKVTQLGASYNFGNIAVGYTQASIDQTDNTEDKQKEYGVTYAVNDKTTVGVLYATTDNNSADDETITAVQMGYNLGALSVEAYAIKIESLAGSATAKDVEKFGLRLGTKF
jgi:hypothetical protein